MLARVGTIRRVAWLARRPLSLLVAAALLGASCTAGVDVPAVTASPAPVGPAPSPSPGWVPEQAASPINTSQPTAAATLAASPTPVPCVRRVVIISFDGLRPDALSTMGSPSILGVATRGAYDWSAQTVLPSTTLQAHASMLSGYEIVQHGIYWNDYIESRGYIATSTLFSIAKDHGLRTAMVAGKEKLLHIAAPGTVDDYELVSGGDGARAEAAVRLLEQGSDVLFLHLRSPDNAGHSEGWMSSGYLEAVTEADQAAGRVLQALQEAGMADSTLVILTADHGGHQGTHGTDLPEDMTIPWILAGPGIVAGKELASDVRVTDTAATALWALGLPLPDDISGQPVLEAFLPTYQEACLVAEVLWRVKWKC